MIDMPVPSKSRISSRARSRAGRGRAEGPALKLSTRRTGWFYHARRAAARALRATFRGRRAAQMLLSREEMTFDFGGHKLDPVRDKDVLAWATHQFLYGEVTGIQIGH